MAFWAYLLRCADGSFYAGHTDNLDARIAQHRCGRGSDYTARRQPVTPAWSQDFADRLEALEAERRVKGWSRAKKMALIAGDWDAISYLASSATRPSTSSGRTGDIGTGDPPSFETSPTVRPKPFDFAQDRLVEGRATNAAPIPCP
jgi:putative endonuclease